MAANRNALVSGTDLSRVNMTDSAKTPQQMKKVVECCPPRVATAPMNAIVATADRRISLKVDSPSCV